MPSSARLLLPLALLLTMLPLAGRASDSTVVAVGLGMQRMPAWPGSKHQREDPIPYIDVELPGIGSLSTLDGLEVELLHGPALRGGFYGSYQWGRERTDLGSLGGKVPSLAPRLNAGGYLEWQLNKSVDVGANLSHDTAGAGAYLNLYADTTLPPIGRLEEAASVRWSLMNGAAMNRFFGLGPASASALGVTPWHPGAGSEMASLEYDLYLPTSRHTGVALAVVYGRLLGGAGNSPLVSRFGSTTQWSQSLAFIYHP
ncbi:MAG: structural protein MipA [Lysobacterales bacterium 14-68-21]|jgi:outer membrane scaffolding protein for murein synthesis (MipA/OmpV family)|nr:MAG: structural protein MipA [Xanthomonadales bacterium 15-68-25]OZB67095.1 MAG: structural protein MipA [Xanthomonadales bacterium 14-68-21]